MWGWVGRVSFVRGKELALEIMASDRGCLMQLKREEEILLILVHILRFLFFFSLD